MNGKAINLEDLDSIFITPEENDLKRKKLKIFLKNAERLILTGKCMVAINHEFVNSWGEENKQKSLKWFMELKTKEDIFERMTDKKYHKINGKIDCWSIGEFKSVWSETTINGERVTMSWIERPEGTDCEYDYIIMIDPHNCGEWN